MTLDRSSMSMIADGTFPRTPRPAPRITTWSAEAIHAKLTAAAAGLRGRS